MKKCEVSPQYGKDDFNNLHFYCDFCGKEMGYEKQRICLAEREKCPHCNSDVGDAEMLVSTCFSCDKEI